MVNILCTKITDISKNKCLIPTYDVLSHLLLVAEEALVVLEGGEVAVNHLRVVPHPHCKPPDNNFFLPYNFFISYSMHVFFTG